MKYLANLQKYFDQHKNEELAAPMRKYMKDRYDYLGIKSPERRILLRKFIEKEGMPSRSDIENIAVGLWSLPYREYQYIGLELVDRLTKKTIPEDIYAIEYMMEYKQWWDTIDFIATHLAGKLFLQHPEMIDKYFQKWINSDNMWVNRGAILFQLKYKKKTDLDLLTTAILTHNKSKEFFHQKAIGWILREYAKTDTAWVRNFVETNDLANLSRREALKHFR